MSNLGHEYNVNKYTGVHRSPGNRFSIYMQIQRYGVSKPRAPCSSDRGIELHIWKWKSLRNVVDLPAGQLEGDAQQVFPSFGFLIGRRRSLQTLRM